MSQEKGFSSCGIALIALGSNATSRAGGPVETLSAAVEELRAVFLDVQVSRIFQTPAFPEGSGPDFANAACAFPSELDPTEILTVLHRIEAGFGRERILRWGQRTLDLDLIGVGQIVLPDAATFDHWLTLPLEAQKVETPPHLVLPHPRLQDRPFVLVPLADVAPEWRHPVLGRTVAEMLAAHPQSARDAITVVT